MGLGGRVQSTHTLNYIIKISVLHELHDIVCMPNKGSMADSLFNIPNCDAYRTYLDVFACINNTCLYIA